MKARPAVPAHDAFDSHPQRLDREQSLELLRSVGVGRAAWADQDGRVVVVPVGFTVLEDAVLFRTAEGDKLAAVRRGTHFAFEADEVEPALRTGWSVLVHGTPEIVSDSAEHERLGRLLPSPWDRSAPKPYLVLLRIDEVSGRRLPLHPGGVAFGP